MSTDLKEHRVRCPLCDAVMDVMPLNNALTCTKCMTRLPIDKVTWINEVIDKATAYDRTVQGMENVLRSEGE